MKISWLSPYIPTLAGTIQQDPGISTFWRYVWLKNQNHLLFILFIGFVQWTVFKYFYPFPSLCQDGYYYIFAAYRHLDVNIWPIGYSWFLSIFHGITSSHIALTTFQFAILLTARCYFYFTILYFFRPPTYVRGCLAVFFFINPLFLYINNFVGSDTLFISISLCWFVQLIRILHRPRGYQIFVQAILVFIAFVLRYNAMIYPLVAVGVFLLSRQKPWLKWTGILLGPILIVPFILFSSNAAKQMTGTAQFPPILGGWQWANNALYMRQHITVDSTKFPTRETAELDAIARRFFQLNPNVDIYDTEFNFFIGVTGSPLNHYMFKHYKTTTRDDFIESSGKVAVIFDLYGKYLIKRHPFEYARYYLLANTKRYFWPPLEVLHFYNQGMSKIYPVAQSWFQLPNDQVTSISPTIQGKILAPLMPFFLVMNIFYCGSLLLFIYRRSYKKMTPAFNGIILVASLFLALNFAFSIFATMTVLRYQIFPLLILLPFALLLISYPGRNSYP